MAKGNKISITGDLGSGKSVVARILVEKLQMAYLSTGSIQREIAARYGMTTLELNKYAETHPEIDDEIDGNLKRINESDGTYIIDSRLGWFFVPVSFKVFLAVRPEVAAQRILGDTKRKSETYSSLQEAIELLRARKKSENERFLRVYHADCGNMNNFDCVIDTSDKTPEQVAEGIISSFHAWVKSDSVLR